MAMLDQEADTKIKEKNQHICFQHRKNCKKRNNYKTLDENDK